MTVADILAFIKKQELMVLATVDGLGNPEAAVVEFGEQEDLTLIIDTLVSSRKYANLQKKKEVAIVIGWKENVTVQINALAHELNGKELANAKAAYFSKNKRAQKWENRPDIAYFGFKPTWIRYSDVGRNPWIIEEFQI